jgi:hypothetical protein
LKDFAFRNAVKVDALEDFDDHVKRLIRNLDRLLETRGHVQKEIATPAREPQRDLDESPEHSASHRSSAVQSGGRGQDHAAGPPASGDVSSRTRAPKEEHARPAPDRRGAPAEAEPSRQLQTPTRVGPLLILPGIVIVLYAILYITGIWKLGQTLLYTPAVPLAQAGLFSFCMVRYGRAGAAPSLLGGAALWLASSVLSVTGGLMNSTILADMPASSRAFYMAVSGTVSSVLLAAAIMAIGMLLCPVLRRRRYWIIALVGYPLLFFVSNAAVPGLTTSVDRNSLAALYFAAVVVRQVAVFACLGLWVSQPHPPAASVSRL